MKKTIAMIPAAGRGSRMMSLTEDNPKAMLPLHNKPLIAWHLDKLIEEKIKDAIIIVGYKKEKLIEYVNKFYSDKINITYVEQKSLKGLAHAIGQGINTLSNEQLDTNSLLIILGDTIIIDPLNDIINKDFSWIGYKEVNDYKRWCLMETENNNISGFIDKPDYDPITRKAVIGIYYFSNIRDIKNSINKIIEMNKTIKGEFQLSSAMEIYMENHSLEAIEFSNWYDCGEVETFNNTRKNITRHFNNIKLEDNVIIKSSPSNNKKIIQEIDWYVSLPNRLKVYLPQLIDFNKNDGSSEPAFYELEYINFTPMQELFLYNLPDIPTWEKLFENVFHMIDKFKQYSVDANFDYDAHEDVYITKTNNRIEELKSQNPLWEKIMSQNFITINGKAYKNMPLIIDEIFDIVRENILTDCRGNWQIIHGDLFFGNMLYDINSNTLKVIDPRGNFGKDGIYGDIRYDIAKLYHSIYGKYDFIVNDLYSLQYNNHDFNYIIYDSKRHEDIIKMFDKYIENNGFYKNDIFAITSLLFMSMIPLHKENLNNQIMMYLTAIQMFNEIIKK